MTKPAHPGLRASLIIVAYNSRDDIETCLRSVLPTLSGADELIVVDNASSDGTAEVVKAAFPTVQVLRPAENLGFGGGNNLGVRHARGEFLAFLNPDTTVEPGWLEALIEVLQTHPQAGLATAKILQLGNPGQINTCGNEMHISGLTLCRGMGEPHTAYTEQDEVGAISGAAFTMRRELFETLGGFDERFFLYVEDSDLSLRARMAGWRIVYVPRSIVHHDYRLTFGPRKTYYQERNRYQMLLKTLRKRTLLVLLPALLLAELVAWGFVLLRERKHLTNKLRAYGWVIQQWRRLNAAHRQCQALRQVSDQQLLKQMIYPLGYEQTGDGLLPGLAHWLFDPLFWLARRFAILAARLICA